jgi:hypothetical protein
MQNFFEKHYSESTFGIPPSTLEMDFANQLTCKDEATLRIAASRILHRFTLQEVREGVSVWASFNFQKHKFNARWFHDSIEVDYQGPVNPLLIKKRKSA